MATLLLKDKVSEDLSLRNMVSNIFKTEEFQKDDDVMIDFTGIKSISRSFAHEYLQHKERQNCKVLELNMPSNIKKMFEIVESTKIKSELVKNSVPLEISLQ
jgi:Asp-tRNA(Asn)/Glu-tRNA(Gln) amidotransferase B subunit